MQQKQRKETEMAARSARISKVDMESGHMGILGLKEAEDKQKWDEKVGVRILQFLTS
jgi:hypothetical protein